MKIVKNVILSVNYVMLLQKTVLLALEIENCLNNAYHQLDITKIINQWFVQNVLNYVKNVVYQALIVLYVQATKIDYLLLNVNVYKVFIIIP